MTKFKWYISIFLFLAIYISGCDGEVDPRLYEFTSQDPEIKYSFFAKTSDPKVIAAVEKQLKKPLEDRNLHIHGYIARGDDGYNNWNWHFIPGEWQLAEISVEVCDGIPSMVDENVDYWVNQVGYFCPWSSQVLREVEPTPFPIDINPFP